MTGVRMSEPKDTDVASVLDISQTQHALLSAPAFIAWGQTIVDRRATWWL